MAVETPDPPPASFLGDIERKCGSRHRNSRRHSLESARIRCCHRKQVTVPSPVRQGARLATSAGAETPVSRCGMRAMASRARGLRASGGDHPAQRRDGRRRTAARRRLGEVAARGRSRMTARWQNGTPSANRRAQIMAAVPSATRIPIRTPAVSGDGQRATGAGARRSASGCGKRGYGHPIPATSAIRQLSLAATAPRACSFAGCRDARIFFGRSLLLLVNQGQRHGRSVENHPRAVRCWFGFGALKVTCWPAPWARD